MAQIVGTISKGGETNFYLPTHIGPVTISVNGVSATIIYQDADNAVIATPTEMNDLVEIFYTAPDFSSGGSGGQGPAGEAATITLGSVTTGAAGSSASITNSGSSSAAVFNFTIPRGDTGATGPAGADGAAGAAGPGVPTGGTSGQLLRKISSTNYDTQWWTPNYLTSYTETDPVFSASASFGITSTNISNWNSAFSWGNHASAGYLLSSTASSTYQPLDADLTAIAGLAGTTGFLRKTAANTWSLDTSTHLTSSDIGVSVQAYDADLAAWAGVAPSSKQDTLVSGTNIKTINGTSILGAGNLIISGSGAAAMVDRMTATQATSGTALTDVTQLADAMVANGVYEIDCFVTFQSTATTAGLNLGFTAPTGAVCMLEVVVPITSTAAATQLRTTFPNTTSTNSGNVLGTGVTAINSNHTARISGIVVNGSTAGNFQVRFASEVSGQTITLQIGSTLVMKQIA